MGRPRMNNRIVLVSHLDYSRQDKIMVVRWTEALGGECVKVTPPNPPVNSLPAGLAEAAVIDAVARSGYPLQLRVASLLRRLKFSLDEEWAYVDRDTGGLRP